MFSEEWIRIGNKGSGVNKIREYEELWQKRIKKPIDGVKKSTAQKTTKAVKWARHLEEYV